MIALRNQPVGYRPLDVLSQLHQQINHIFEGSAEGRAVNATAATADWIPPADIEQYEDRFVLRVDVPGVPLESVDVTMEQGVLSISGERKQEVIANGAQRGRIERPHGRFHRRFTLPDTVDGAGISATGRNGVLEVVIPKQPKAQPRRIEIATS